MLQNYDELRSLCLNCQNCGLAATRKNVVFGTGNPNAQVMFIGEGPGENEDLTGEPFVGRGGQLLDKLLASVDLSREKNIYIANMALYVTEHTKINPGVWGLWLTAVLAFSIGELIMC